MCPDQFDPTTQHTVIPCVVTENARVNSRSCLPDPQLLTSSSDPPQFTPARREDISLPPSADALSKWIWISKWTLSQPEPWSGSTGWMFAQRWDTREGDWVVDAASLTPISRAGLVARRKWVRIMKRCPVGEDYIGEVETSELEMSESEFSQAPAGKSSASTERTSAPKLRGPPVRANSMGARIVGLVAGTPKGK